MKASSSFALRILVLLGLALTSQVACASVPRSGTMVTGKTLQEVPLSSVVERLRAGSVAIVGEEHGLDAHHENQVQFLEALAAAGAGPISVGLEFFARPSQDALDRFTSGQITETEFLKEVGWGKSDFSDYRKQVLFPGMHGGKALAINAPRALTSRVAKVGIEGLTTDEKSQLPPGFALGNDLYFERFRKTMEGHVPEESIRRYFEAQSIWDDTMAWSVSEFLRQHPDQRVVIIVGDFHVAYGGGLPDRLRARGLTDVTAVSQVNVHGLPDSEARAIFHPHPTWGPRGEFVWITR